MRRVAWSRPSVPRAARRKAGGETVVGEAAGHRRFRGPAVDGRAVEHLEGEGAVGATPDRKGVPGMAERERAVMRLGQRNEPAGAPIAGGKAGFGFERGDLVFQ